MNRASASERSPENGCNLSAVPALTDEDAGTTSSRPNHLQNLGRLVDPEPILLVPLDDDTQELVEGAQVLETTNENLAHACENTAIEDGVSVKHNKIIHMCEQTTYTVPTRDRKMKRYSSVLVCTTPKVSSVDRTNCI
jgi:hypothetical protein